MKDFYKGKILSENSTEFLLCRYLNKKTAVITGIINIENSRISLLLPNISFIDPL